MTALLRLATLLAAALVAVVALPGPAAEGAGPSAPPFVSTFGATVEDLDMFAGWGDDPGQFDIPLGVAVAPNGHVYVADTGNDRVQQFTGNGTSIRQWGQTGAGPGQFAGARSIAVDHEGFVYVVDAGNLRIQKFTADGTYVTEWDDAAGDPLVGMNTLAFGGTARHLYVISYAVSGAGGVRVFDRAGGFVRLLTFPAGAGAGQASSPEGVGVSPDDQVYVADTGNDRIQQFTATGTFVREWGETGSGPGQFDSPVDVTVDSAGDVWVTDGPPNNRVQVFSADGTYKFGFGSPGFQLGQFRYPGQVAVSSRGSAYVLEENNHRVSRWARPLTDARIRRGATGPLAGNNVYNTTGTGQTRTGAVPGGGRVSYYVSVQNDVPEAEAFRVRGEGGTSRFTVRYFAGPTNVTTQVRAGTYTTPTLAPGGVHTIRAEVTALRRAPRGSVLTRSVTVRADSDTARVDKVRFTTTRT